MIELTGGAPQNLDYQIEDKKDCEGGEAAFHGYILQDSEETPGEYIHMNTLCDDGSTMEQYQSNDPMKAESYVLSDEDNDHE